MDCGRGDKDCGGGGEVTTSEKLMERLSGNPHGVSFSEIRKLLEEHDFTLDRITGSHHIFKRGPVIIVIPVHNKRVKVVYVRRVVEIIKNENKKVKE
jgi:predicted RNA binding protein YcfA (HicA-like mRNA interferase family)